MVAKRPKAKGRFDTSRSPISLFFVEISGEEELSILGFTCALLSQNQNIHALSSHPPLCSGPKQATWFKNQQPDRGGSPREKAIAEYYDTFN